MSRRIQRRSFLTLLGGAVAAWARAVHAQQSGRMRRIGVLMPGNEGDQVAQERLSGLQQGLIKFGWIDGRNVRIDIRWGGIDPYNERASALELVSLRPDVLFAGGTPELVALRPARSVPIVFALVSDPIGGGFVASLSRPGGNITGFMSIEPPIAGKWMQLLKGMAPGMTRVALVFNPEVATYAGEYFRHAQAAAASLAVELSAAPVHDDLELEAALAAFAREPDGGLVLVPDTFTRSHRERIIALAAQYHLPAIHSDRRMATAGALMTYGDDVVEEYRQAASYIDRILRGEKAADLPVQAATRFQLVINLKTAKDLGLSVSADMLSIADEVIE